jgi:hypothetical protein
MGDWYCPWEATGRRHRPHWIKPYLKAEMIYGMRVLLHIVDLANAGILSNEMARQQLKEVKFSGPLIGNHLLRLVYTKED